MDDVLCCRDVADEQLSKTHHLAIVTLVDCIRVILNPSLGVTADVRLRCRHDALHTTTDTVGDENVDRQSKSRPESTARPDGNDHDVRVTVAQCMRGTNGRAPREDLAIWAAGLASQE